MALGTLNNMEEDMIRLLADFENYKKQAKKEMESLKERGGEEVIKELLPLLDDLRMAATSDGMVLIYQKFLRTFEKLGVRQIGMEGEFNTDLHEAVQTMRGRPGKIIKCVRPGYVYKGKVIRYAQVIVGI